MSLNEELPLTLIEAEQVQVRECDDRSVSDNRQNQDKENASSGLYDSKGIFSKRIRKKGASAPLKEENNESIIATSSNSSSYDICRICHMGNPTSEQSQGSSSANLDLGQLVSACRCRGTVGLVHIKCLERWLTESGNTECELCGYLYATIRVPRYGLFRSFLIWIKTFVVTRQMFLDSLYLLVTTPLAVFSAYVCVMTLKMALENRMGEIPWTIIAMLPTCLLTLVAYWGWLLTLQRLHGMRWHHYWQSNFIVRLVPNADLAADPPSAERRTPDEPATNDQDYFTLFDFT